MVVDLTGIYEAMSTTKNRMAFIYKIIQFLRMYAWY